MADPVIDENLIVDLLDVPPSPDTARQLMAGATMLLIDAYDRQISRDYFVSVVHNAMSLHTYAGQYGAVTNTQRLLADGKLSAEVLVTSSDAAVRLLNQYIALCLRQAHLLRECPLSTDRVH
jgi:hypothetical protein